MSAIRTIIRQIISKSRRSDGKRHLYPREPLSIARDMTAERVHAALATAESGDTRDLFCLYRDMIVSDSHMQAEFSKRKLAVIGDRLSFNPVNKSDSADIRTADSVRAAIAGLRGWRRSCAHILDGVLYPVSVTEKVFTPSSTPGLRYDISMLLPVPHYLLTFRSGYLQIHDCDPQTGAILSTAHDPDPDRYIVHRGHLLSTPDNWGGPMRSILFWWLLSAMSRDWWARFLERYGSPWLLGKFRDDPGKSILERAFALSTRLGGLVTHEDTSVEIKQAAASDSGDAYEKFLSICNREKSKLIVGQSLSAEAQPTGMNSGANTMAGDVLDSIRQCDASLLSDTICEQIATQFCRINALPGRVPSTSWGSDSIREKDSLSKVLASLTSAGLTVTDSDLPMLSAAFGLSLMRAPAPSAFQPSTPFLGSWSVRAF